jgi:transposase InsO family protein
MRAEFFTPRDRAFTAIGELQDALDARVNEYSTARPHQSCGGRPPSGSSSPAAASPRMLPA